jgi:hypothetical protein
VTKFKVNNFLILISYDLFELIVNYKNHSPSFNHINHSARLLYYD